MNILFLTYQGGIAGSTNSIIYLSKALADKGHTIYIGCSKDRLLWQALENSNVKLWEIDFKNKIDISSAKKIAKFAKENSIDIVNAQSSKDRYASSLAKGLFGMKAKVVHTRRQVSKSAGFFIQKLFYEKWTDAIVAVSRGVKQSLINIGLPENKIEVIYNGSPLEKYLNINYDKTLELKEKLNINQNCFVIGCVSRRKKQIQLLKAAAKIKTDKLIKIIFIGIEDIEDKEKIMKNLPSNVNVYFEGIKTNEETLAYYKIFDVFVLPSTTEGFSQSLLESCFIGVPAIATNASGNNELISDRIDGFLFEDGNIDELTEKIELLMNDENLRKTFAERMKEKAKKFFTIECVRDNYENFFIKLIQNN